MSKNVGTIDRILRIILGLALLWLVFFSGMAAFDNGWPKVLVLAVGVIMLATAGLRLCPIYSLLGLKTCKNC